jgi:cystathionine beta-lyase/cystathionine gamma-synthase
MDDMTKGDPGAPRTGVGNALWVNQLLRKRKPGPSRAGGEFGACVRGMHAETCAVHAGTFDDPLTGAVGTPIYQTSTFILGEDQYRAVEEGYARDRFIYTRYGNPSQWAVQEKLAALEGAESALVFSSGMAAISASVLALLDKGAHIIASDELYGGTYGLFHQELVALGFAITYVSPRDIEGIRAAIRPNTTLMYFEAMTNPLLKVVDIEAIAGIARKCGARLVIDATFVTPLGCRPLELGADIVVHSCTKYLNGHSDLVAGAALGSRKLLDAIWPRLLAYGGCLDPHACFLLERSLKTLALRMRAHQEGAEKVARFLSQHPRVRKTIYPGLPGHPDRALVQRIMRNTGGMVTFNVASDAQALEFLKRLRLMREATSLGGVESLISLPFNTSHAAFTVTQRARLGIEPGCIRLSVGIEHPDDLIADLGAALDAMPEV